MKKYLALLLALLLVASLFAACGDKAAEESAAPSRSARSEASTAPAQPDAEPSVEPVALVADQYYTNENFMIEMLIGEGCAVEESGSHLTIATPEGHAMIILSLIPGVQNLSAAAEMAANAVAAIPGATAAGAGDGNLFGARAKIMNFEVADEGGAVTTMGVSASTVVNQSCYLFTMLMEMGMSSAEGDLIVSVFDSMNVLRPAAVDQGSKQAAYTSHYQEQLDAKTVTLSVLTKAQPVTEWVSLPYDYYDWLGDYGDYGDYPSWYYEPDWDYYSDPGDYWDWGWDDSDDWAFYDDYSDYYSYDYYDDYDDYWGDDFDPWSDPGDYGYEDYYYEEEEAYGTFDDGDGLDYGYGDYVEEDGYGDYVEEDGYGDYFE